MYISVVVPARNAESTLKPCLEALREQQSPGGEYEVIVIDDASEDATAEIAGENADRILSSRGRGPAAARNRGVEAARGDVIAFTDSDCVPERDWMRRITEPLANGQVAGTKGTYRTEQMALTARFVQLEYESKYRRMARRTSIDFIDTYSAAYRKDDLVAVGGFDEGYSLPSVEDQELSFRLAKRGKELRFVPEAIVRHLHADSPWRYFLKKVRIGYWKARLLGRHPDRLRGDSHTPLSLFCELGSVGLAVATAPAALILGGPIRWVPLLSLALFTGSSLCFALRAVRRDPAVAAASPFFLLVRALGLGFGLVLGGASLLAGRMQAPRETDHGV